MSGFDQKLEGEGKSQHCSAVTARRICGASEARCVWPPVGALRWDCETSDSGAKQESAYRCDGRGFSWTPGVAALARVTWLCVRGLGRLTILRLPACVSNLDFALKSYGPEKVLCGR